MLMREEWALGAILIELGPSRAPEAERLLADGLARAKEVRLLEPADKEAVRNESVMASTYAQALAALGRLPEAEKMLGDAAATRLQLWQRVTRELGDCAGLRYRCVGAGRYADSRARSVARLRQLCHGARI